MRAVGWLLVVVSIVGCAMDAGYPVVSGTNESHPVTVGTDVPAVAVYLQPRPNDRIEILSADGVGSLQGADVAFFFSPPVAEPGGLRTIGVRLEPIAGAIVPTEPAASEGPDRAVGIVAVITPKTHGTFSLTEVRIRLRVNGRDIVRAASTTVVVCAALPAPSHCDAPAVS